MRAVIQTGGKQYRVAIGDVLQVERQKGHVGEEIALGPILMLQDEAGLSCDPAVLSVATVKGQILRQDRDRKVLVFKKKRRKNYRRTQGHRQALTHLKITTILKGG